MMMNPVTQPPPPPGAFPPPAQPQPPAAAAKPKVKPKVAARPKEDAPAGQGTGKGGSGTRIALLVNGDPITAYELEQRARLMALSSDIGSRAQANMKQLATSEGVNARWKQIVQETIQANSTNGKSRDQIIAIIQEKQKAYSMGLQKQAVESARSSAFSQPEIRSKAREELIEETIKIQDAKRNGAAPDESMVEDLIKDIAQRNKKTPKEFAEHFAGMGVDISTLKARFRAQLAWTEAVRKQYSHLAVPNNRDLDRLLQKDAGGEDHLELQLHRIVIPVPPKLDQKLMATRLAEAEQLQGQFKDCRSTSVLAAKVQGARFENMGSRSVASFTGASRTMLQSAQENSMIPPTITSTGIELIAVCSRRVIKADDVNRNKAANEIRQDTMERHARGHLRKLINDAVIENR